MPEYFSWQQTLSGLKFELPRGGVAAALAVFGITGVGATELFMYPYWCVEKGYARFAGERQHTSAWQNRARGWVRVMQTDVVIAMVVYTTATMAFYLLGAGVLRGMGIVPSASDMISVLSNIYTQTLGGWSLWLFYAGAVAVLYSSIFAATAAHARMFADLCRMFGLYARNDNSARTRYRNGLVVVFTIVPVLLYYVLQSPVKMVVFGGVVQAGMLPVIAASVLYLRHRRLPAELRPSAIATAGLWFASLTLSAAVGYALFG